MNTMNNHDKLNQIIYTAFKRSFNDINKLSQNNIFVFLSDESLDSLKKQIEQKSKIIVFGKLNQDIAQLLGLEVFDQFPQNTKKSIVCLDQNMGDNSSIYHIKYTDHECCANVGYDKRYFTRFDFMDEWNNIGYGRIGIEDDIWSVRQIVKNNGAQSLAKIYDDESCVSEFATISDFENSSVLYINRDVGTIDGLDWTIVEHFISRYRMDELPCAPLILDIPFGYEAIATPRLDCDQSVIDTKPLVDLYKSYGINLSLAIATGINISEEEIQYLNQFYANGGALLSHSVNHFFNWGDCYDIAYDEAKKSKEWLEKNIVDLEKLEYAVSPFHTNKPYSAKALQEAGYKGFISGIIHNDPEYLLGVSGEVPFSEGNIVSHSQQCMLHGDCYHRNSNSLDIYKQSFNAHYKAKKMFGYLDHPFGDYDYGWHSEEERLDVHKEFIEYINSFDGIKWMTSTEVLQFVYDKSQLEIAINTNDTIEIKRKSSESPYKIAVEYKGQVYVC